MFKLMPLVRAVALTMVVALCPIASHAMAVTDAGAIARLIQQIRVMNDQLRTARDQLSQAERAYRSVTGGRGMENLLADSVRNYLPPDYAELESAIRDTSGTYRALAGEIRSAVDANAILAPADLMRWTPEHRAMLTADRQAQAARQALTREALRSTSQRFSSLQRLIDAIGDATDTKAVMDLQARIAVEQAMLTNEQSKLEMLHQVALAEDSVRRQRAREQAMADVGSLRALAPMGLH